MRSLMLLAALAAGPADAPPRDESAAVAVPRPSEQAMRYYRSGVVLWFVDQAWIVLVPAVVLATGLSAKVRGLAERIGRGRWVLVVGVYGVLYLALYELASLPLAYYAGFVRPHEYGLSVETLPHWLGDAAKGFAVMAGFALAGLWLPYLALRKLPRRWPWAVAAGYLPVSFALMFVVPVAIDPLFNDFGPMTDRALEADILALASRSGIEGGRVFQVDKSRETKTINAYVKGFLGTKRIVLWDTLLAKLDRREVLFVMGHEMGHFVLGHVVRSLLVGTIGVLAACLFVQVAGSALLRRWGTRFGFDRLADPASLPLLLVLGNLFVFAASPAAMAYSRYQEHEADRFALELTRDNHAGATAFVTMQHENLSNPRPGWLSVLWRSTHPSLGDRIDFCNRYRPWERGEPLSYGSLFR